MTAATEKRNLKDMLEQFHRLEERIIKAITEEYPIGRTVDWRHGEHWRTGEIVDHSGLRVSNAAFKIKTAGNCVYWVCAWRVILEGK